MAATPAETDPYAQRVTAQAVAFLYHTLPGVIVSITLMPVAMVAVMWARVDRGVLIGWCTAAFAVTAWRLTLNRMYVRCAPAPSEAARWGRRYTITALASGLAWGVAGMLFFVPDSTAHQVFLFTSIVGLCAGSIILNSYWIASYYAFALPALSLSSARMLAEGGFAYQGLAALTLMLGVVLLQVAHGTRKSALAAIRLRFENLDLVERLRQEKGRAEDASRDKTRFLASASHDLRQPVHALTLFADALRVEQTSERGKALLGDMGQSIHALNQLLESLIDISKLDAGVVKPAPMHFALRPLIERLRAEYLPQARAGGLDFAVSGDDRVVHSDPALLEAILRNLISNAIRYTPSGRIDVTCGGRDRVVHIDVRDTGIGVPHDRQRDIFREFYQLHNPERDRSKGLGLGLAIVARLASLLGHRIELRSAPGEGSCFTVALPEGEMCTVAATDTVVETLEPQDLRGMRVLVIDDEVAVRRAMSALLESWGCRAMLAGSETEALGALDDGGAADVIIADYRLSGGKTGVEVIERLRRAIGAEVPALIVTGDTDPQRIREAQSSGHALMHKPVQPGKLRAYLRRVRRLVPRK